jgi:putative ABC transport system permease protein
MTAAGIAINNLLHKKLSSALSLVLMSFGVALISLLLNSASQIQNQFQKNLAGIDMVVGAKGSPLQIILCNVFHIDFPTGNIRESDVEWLKRNRLVKNAIPISLGDSYQNFRLVGCTEEYINLYNATVINGKFFEDEMQAVIGSDVASELGLKPGDHFESAHGMEDNDIMGHEEHPFLVTGILGETGTVIDQLILTSNESIRHLHHSQEKEITALLLQFRSPMGAIQLPRQINARSNLQAASPAFEAARLFSLLNRGIDVIKYIGAGIMVMAGFSIFISLFIALKERKYELALLRSFGAGRSYVFIVVFAEATILSVLGYVIGIVLCHTGLLTYNYFSDVSAYRLNASYWVVEELYLFIFGLLIATLAAIVPAVKAYKTDIADTLSNANA